MPKSPAMQKEFEDWLRGSLDRIKNFLNLNAPDLIIGHAIAHLFSGSIGYLGESVTEEFSRYLIRDARNRIGRCQHCDTEIPAALTHPPICEQCDARIETEVERLDQDFGIGEG